MTKSDHTIAQPVKRTRRNKTAMAEMPWNELKALLIREFHSIRAAAQFFDCDTSAFRKLSKCPRIRTRLEEHFA